MANSSTPDLSDATDLDEIPASLPGWEVECIHLGPGPMNHRAIRIAFGTGSLTSFRMSRAGILRGTTAPDSRVLVASIPSAPPLLTRARPIGGETCLVLEPGARLDLYLPEGCTAMVLSLCADSSLAVPPALTEDGQLRALSAPHAAILQDCIESLQAKGERSTQRRVRELLQSTAPALFHEAAPRATPKGERSQRHRAVTRACDYIDAHLREPLALADLCSAAGVCTRTLEYGFRDFYELGPMAYVRNLRLCRVRRELLHPSRVASSVSSAARRWSFTHMGQFSCDYRVLFGEVPSTTLTRHRHQPGGDAPR